MKVGDILNISIYSRLSSGDTITKHNAVDISSGHITSYWGQSEGNNNSTTHKTGKTSFNSALDNKPTKSCWPG